MNDIRFFDATNDPDVLEYFSNRTWERLSDRERERILINTNREPHSLHGCISTEGGNVGSGRT